MKRAFFRRLLLWLLALLLLPIMAVLLFYGLVRNGAFGPVPDREELADIRNAEASLILDRKAEVLGKIFTENRTSTSYEELPLHLVNALIATEDARFFEHEGIDPRSVARVLVKSLLLGDKSAGGGSTLSQQLAKNLYGRSDHGFLSLPVSKLKEMIIATRLEDIYEKEELLELYLNTVPFSENIYGVETASRRFFNVDPVDLEIHQSAVLVAMLKANTYYNPRLHPDHALQRRNVVLRQMSRYGYLADEELDSLAGLPLDVEYFNPVQQGTAQYYLRQVKQQVERIMKEHGLDDIYDVQTDGLRVYTGLDLGLQQLARAAYDRHLNNLQALFDRHWQDAQPWGSQPDLLEKELRQSISWQLAMNRGLSEEEARQRMTESGPAIVYHPEGDTIMNLSPRDSVAYYLRLLRAGFVALDPDDGAILAWVGGRDWQYMPYDHVLSRRQVGSTFKPVVFAATLEQGMSPCTYWENEPRRYAEYQNWSPQNYDNNYGGYYSTRGALKRSVNVAAAQAIFKAGVAEVIALARRLGIDAELNEHPSLALGTASISLLEMAQAYAVFASGGIHHEPWYVKRITTRDGKLLYQREDTEGERVIDERTAALMSAMLEAVIEDGTARSLRSTYEVEMTLAGKTGTSQNYSDTWFIAYNPDLVAATWVGGVYPAIRFRSGVYGSSSRQALPMLGYFFGALEEERSMAPYQSQFSELTDEWQNELGCEDFREKNIFDDLKNIFDKREGEKIKREKEDKPGFFKRIFGEKDKG